MTAGKNQMKPKTQLVYPHVVVETSIDILNKKLLDTILKSPNRLDLSTALEETWLKYHSIVPEEVERKLGTPRHAIQITDPHDQNQKKYVVMGEFFFTHYADGNNVLGFRLDGREYLHPFPDFPRFEHLVISTMTLGKSREFRIYRCPGESLGQELWTEEEWFKVSSELEMNILGRTPHELTSLARDHPRQMYMFDQKTEEGERLSVAPLGLDFTEGQHKALKAIQILLDKTDYKGNRPREFLSYENISNYKGPILAITLKEYLDAYETGKSKTKRGKMEYHRQERDDAIKNLEKLQTPVKVFYSRPNKDGTRDLTIQTLPLLRIIQHYPGITSEEEEHIRNTGTPISEDGYIYIVAEYPLVNGIIDYKDKPLYRLYPRKLLADIKTQNPKAGKIFYNFVSYLSNQAYSASNRHKKGKGIQLDVGLYTLAHRLRMDSYIKARKKKQARDRISSICEDAKKLGYLLDYNLINCEKSKDNPWGAKLEATINKAKFLPDKDESGSPETSSE